jgi:hypothetical protein
LELSILKRNQSSLPDLSQWKSSDSVTLPYVVENSSHPVQLVLVAAAIPTVL